jgi:hypothetical protein
MHYEIDETTFAVNIYDGVNPEPFWYQPQYPNGDTFDSYEEAEEWAKAAMASQNPEHPFFAPNGKNMAPSRKPDEKQMLEMKLAATGLTVDDLKTLLGL